MERLTWRQKYPDRARTAAREYQRRRKEAITGIPVNVRGPYKLKHQAQAVEESVVDREGSGFDSD